ncbi:MAG: N-acetyltransferase [Pseudomonadota bacterium]
MALGHVIRKVRVEDHPFILALLRAAFEKDTEAKIVEALWDCRGIKLERVADIGGVVAGYICYSAVETRPELDGVLLGLGPLAVASDHRNKGVGAELIKESLAECRKNGARLIAVLGDPNYYARFGFEPASDRKMKWAGFDAGDAFRVITHEDIDTEELRTIHYHPAFDIAS